MVAQLFRSRVVVGEGCCWWVGKVDVCDLDVVRLHAGGVGAEQEAVGAEGFARYVLDVWQPLRGEGGPFQSAAGFDSQ